MNSRPAHTVWICLASTYSPLMAFAGPQFYSYGSCGFRVLWLTSATETPGFARQTLANYPSGKMSWRFGRCIFNSRAILFVPLPGRTSAPCSQMKAFFHRAISESVASLRSQSLHSPWWSGWANDIGNVDTVREGWQASKKGIAKLRSLRSPSNAFRVKGDLATPSLPWLGKRCRPLLEWSTILQFKKALGEWTNHFCS